MAGHLRPVPRRLRVAMVAASTLLLLAPAGPASADDIYEIDGRLQQAGLGEAYTEAYEAADRQGVRIVVDFDSDSEDQAAYQREAEQAAELVWRHLDGRVLVVDVAPTYDVPWAEDGLPAAISFDRTALTERFGARPAGRDSADVDTVDDGGLVLFGAVLAGWLLTLGVVGVATFLITRARYRRASTAAPPGYASGGSWAPVPSGYGGGGAGPAAQPGAWPQQAAAPPSAVHGQWPPPPPGQPTGDAAQQAPHDLWRQQG